jgi:uncharacterized protein YciI
MPVFAVAAVLLVVQTIASRDTSDAYYLVLLRRDPARKVLSEAEGERIQSAHMANIRQMAKDGMLVAAGPFEDDPPTISGIFVFKTSSLGEAKRIAAQDPTVVEHRNSAIVVPWHGPKGLSDEYVRLRKENPNTPESMGVHPFCLLVRGDKWDQHSTLRDHLLKKHVAYINDLRRDGKLGAAGDIDDPNGLQGLVIFKRIPIEEARSLLEQDPAIQAGLLRAEYHRWWSSDHVLPW